MLSFGHHIIPLLSSPGAAGASGGKAHLSAVKTACKSAERIHGVLALAGRFELAVVPATPDFFDPHNVTKKVRNHTWETIRETQRLQWVIPTRFPELITSSLPPTWVGKSFHNVCVGYMADSDVDFAKNLQALRTAPLRHRMILLNSASPPIDLHEHLTGIDWVVFVGNPDDAALAGTIGLSCRQAGVAFLFHQSDGRRENVPPIGAAVDGSPCPTHPFGKKIDLARPTLPNLVTHQKTDPEIPIPSTPEGDSSAPPATLAMKTTSPTSEPDKAPEPDHPSPASAAPAPVAGDEAVQDFTRLDGVVQRGLATFIEVGQALAEIRDRELWRAGAHPSWAAYCLAAGGLTKIHANRLIKGSEVASNITQVKPTGFTCRPGVTPRAEWQIRPLHRLPDAEQQGIAWYRAVERANGQPTEKLISAVVAELMADGTASVSSKPNRKELAAEMIHRIRKLNAAGGEHEQIEVLLNELETLLKLA